MLLRPAPNAQRPHHPPGDATYACSSPQTSLSCNGRSTLLGSVRDLYQGMLRTLLVLLHDFPEFLSDYHLSFCDVIPPSCIQLRNLVLAAFPRSMRLPDPFTPNLKVCCLLGLWWLSAALASSLCFQMYPHPQALGQPTRNLA